MKLAIEPVENLAYPSDNISALNGGPPTGTLIWLAVAASTVTLSSITNEPPIKPPSMCICEAVTLPSVCKWNPEELISRFPSEPLTNCSPTLPKKNLFVLTSNSPTPSSLCVLNLNEPLFPSCISRPTPW